MKRVSDLLAVAWIIIVVAPLSIYAQIPNAGFEDWDTCNPIDWATSDGDCSVFNPVTKSTDVHGGSSAVRGEVISFISINITPILQSGQTAEGFPISQRYASVQGFYKFSPVGGDRFVVNIVFTKNGTTVAQGVIADSTTRSTYTQFDVTMTYLTSDVPDTVIIHISIIGPVTGDDFHLGSVMFVDDLSFSGPVAVEEHETIPTDFQLYQNYPNPFNPSTEIRYDLPEASHVSLRVDNVLGQEVAVLVDEEKAAGVYQVQFNASKLTSGVYFYKLQADQFVQTKKLLLLR